MLYDSQIKNLFKLLNTNSPSGLESSVSEYLKNRIGTKCNVYTDVIGNTYMHCGTCNGLKIMLSSHCDEVSFQVTKIDNNGFVYFRRVASPDRQTVCGERLIVVKKEKQLIGVVGKKSPHVMQEAEALQVPDINNLWVDFGFSNDKEASKYISIGDYLVPFSEPFLSNNNSKIISKALDNKISVFILSEVMNMLAMENLPFSVTSVATVQEEVGCRGAIIASQHIHPDIAFCLDVGIATDIPSMKNINEYGHLILGMGPGINVNPENNPILISLLNDVAKEKKIDIQQTIGFRPVRGTETGHIQLSNRGVATALISIPNRYMHSPVEMCDLSDVNNSIKLLYHTIKKIEQCKITDFTPW